LFVILSEAKDLRISLWSLSVESNAAQQS
jgi:hypothetical protein